MATELYTIGHSTHSIERLLELLSMHDITAVCDVRSAPYSRLNPQFNRDLLRQSLKDVNIAYVFLGKELGARSSDPSCYVNGKVQYNKLVKTDLFQQGVARLQKGMKSYRIALMCAEKDPITCHRTILICRQLRNLNVDIKHILWNGHVEHNKQIEKRLMKILHIPDQDLFTTTDEYIERAYDIQGERIAYTTTPSNQSIAEEVEA